MNTRNTNDEEATVFVPDLSTREGLQEYLLTVFKLEKNSPLYNRLMLAPLDMVPKMLDREFGPTFSRSEGIDTEQSGETVHNEEDMPDQVFEGVDSVTGQMHTEVFGDLLYMPKGIEPPKRGRTR